MTINIDPKFDARVREQAEAEGLSVSAYIEQLVMADRPAEEELERLALEGLNSGDPIEAGPEFWAERHRRLDEESKNRTR